MVLPEEPLAIPAGGGIPHSCPPAFLIKSVDTLFAGHPDEKLETLRTQGLVHCGSRNFFDSLLH